MNMNSDLPADIAVAITIGTPFAKCRAIYVGTTGDVEATVNGVAVVFVGVPAGAFLPIRATNIVATNTTADDLVALY